MIHTNEILIIAGSVRPRRIALQIAEWIAALGHAATQQRYAVVDLKQWPLPMDDEPGMPQRGDYVAAHTQAWSDKIDAAPAFVFVMPQYNGGYPAVLKNAIDHLYREWSGKPALIVSYGGHGGDKAAAQLAQVLQFVHARPLPQMPALSLPRAQIEANSGDIDAASVFAGYREELEHALAQLSAASAAA